MHQQAEFKGSSYCELSQIIHKYCQGSSASTEYVVDGDDAFPGLFEIAISAQFQFRMQNGMGR